MPRRLQARTSSLPRSVRPGPTSGEPGKEKGTPMIVPTFEVKYKDKKRPRDAYVVTEGPGSWNFDQLLRAVHMDALADAYKDPAVTPKPPFDTDSLIDQELNVVVVEQLYQGQKRDAINGYLRA